MALRRLILDACPDLTETKKWDNPVYEHDGKLRYPAATKSYVSLGFFYVSLGFFNGAELTDPEGTMDGNGKK